MSRPRVSKENMERIQRYSGDSFDDKLGMLLLLHSTACKENKNLNDMLKKSHAMTMNWMDSSDGKDKEISNWKSTAILTGIGLVCAIGYIWWWL